MAHPSPYTQTASQLAWRQFMATGVVLVALFWAVIASWVLGAPRWWAAPFAAGNALAVWAAGFFLGRWTRLYALAAARHALATIVAAESEADIVKDPTA